MLSVAQLCLILSAATGRERQKRMENRKGGKIKREEGRLTLFLS